VETTTGPLGQGIAVGASVTALQEKFGFTIGNVVAAARAQLAAHAQS
jgi:transketolase